MEKLTIRKALRISNNPERKVIDEIIDVINEVDILRIEVTKLRNRLKKIITKNQ